MPLEIICDYTEKYFSTLLGLTLRVKFLTARSFKEFKQKKKKGFLSAPTLKVV